MSEKPWASGPREILQHGISLLRTNSDSSRRLAFLTIDNAVELIAKTFLGLPNRITGVSLTKREYEECANSFPKLFEVLDRLVSDRMGEVDVGVVEWYHRLRNQLYHNGNGLTVEKAKVETYAGIAIRLYENLFEDKLELQRASRPAAIADYFEALEELHFALSEWYRVYDGSVLGSVRTPKQLAKKGVIDRQTAESIDSFREIARSLTSGGLSETTPEVQKAQVREARHLAKTLIEKRKESE